MTNICKLVVCVSIVDMLLFKLKPAYYILLKRNTHNISLTYGRRERKYKQLKEIKKEKE